MPNASLKEALKHFLEAQKVPCQWFLCQKLPSHTTELTRTLRLHPLVQYKQHFTENTLAIAETYTHMKQPREARIFYQQALKVGQYVCMLRLCTASSQLSFCFPPGSHRIGQGQANAHTSTARFATKQALNWNRI